MTIAGDAISAGKTGLGLISNQTSFVFGAVGFAFLFFITVRGDLGRWLGLLGLAGGAGGAASGTPAAAPGLPDLPAMPGLGALGGAT